MLQISASHPIVESPHIFLPRDICPDVGHARRPLPPPWVPPPPPQWQIYQRIPSQHVNDREVVGRRAFPQACRAFRSAVHVCAESAITDGNLIDEPTSRAVKILRHCQALRSLALTSCQLCDRALRHLPAWNLRSLSLNGCDLSAVGPRGYSALLALAQLETLELSVCEIGDEALEAVARSCKKIKKLTCEDNPAVTDCGVAAVCAGLPCLSSLSLSDCERVTDVGVDAVVSNTLSRLTSLSLAGCDRVTDAGLARVADLGGNLRHLDVYNCFQMRDATPLARLTGLQSLVLSECPNLVDDGTVAAMVEAGTTGLTSLRLEHCPGLTDQGLTALSSLSLLEEFDAADSGHVGDGALEALSHCPRLRRLGLSYTAVTDAGLWALRGHGVEGAEALLRLLGEDPDFSLGPRYLEIALEIEGRRPPPASDLAGGGGGDAEILVRAKATSRSTPASEATTSEAAAATEPDRAADGRRSEDPRTEATRGAAERPDGEGDPGWRGTWAPWSFPCHPDTGALAPEPDAPLPWDRPPVLLDDGTARPADVGYAHASLCPVHPRTPLLEELDLSFCRNLSNAGVRALFDLRSLKALNLEGCRSLGQDQRRHHAWEADAVKAAMSRYKEAAFPRTEPAWVAARRVGSPPLRDPAAMIMRRAAAGVLPDGRLDSVTPNEDGEVVDIADETYVLDGAIVDNDAYAAFEARDEQMSLLALHLRGMVALEDLVLTGCEGVTSRDLLGLAGLTRLTSLQLNDCPGVDRAGAGFRAIRGLRVLGLRGVGKEVGEPLGVPHAEHLSELVAAHPRLQELVLADSGLEDGALGALGGLSRLSALDLSGCDTLTGSGLARLASGFGALEELELRGCRRMGDSGLKAVCGLPTLVSLGLEGCRNLTNGPNGLRQLSRLTLLQRLNLKHCELLSDAGLDALTSLKRLDNLSIGGCRRVTNSGLASLSHLTTTLTDLDLSDCPKITDRGLRHLAPLTALEVLDLSETSIKGHGLRVLATRLVRLNELAFEHCASLEDIALAHVARVTSLQKLSLHHCTGLTDAGATRLTALTCLRELDLSQCQGITEAGVDPLAAMTTLEHLLNPWDQGDEWDQDSDAWDGSDAWDDGESGGWDEGDEGSDGMGSGSGSVMESGDNDDDDEEEEGDEEEEEGDDNNDMAVADDPELFALQPGVRQGLMGADADTDADADASMGED